MMTQGQIIHITGKLLAQWTNGQHDKVFSELANIGTTRSAHLMMTVAVGLVSTLSDNERGRFFNRLMDTYEV